MIASVIQGGSRWEPTDRAYVQQLIARYSAMDYLLRARLDDVESALEGADRA
jgi:hypothetical protein